MSNKQKHPFTAGADLKSFEKIKTGEQQFIDTNENFNLGSGEMFLVAEADFKKNKITGRTCVCVCISNERVTEEGTQPAQYKIKFELVTDEKEKEVPMYPTRED